MSELSFKRIDSDVDKAIDGLIELADDIDHPEIVREMIIRRCALPARSSGHIRMFER
jgi:hypothetical protein